MVTSVTSLTGNGLKDWLIQRVTAVYLAAFAVFIFGYLILHPQLDFGQWSALFHEPWMQIATVMAVGGVTLHAWIGIWTVTTDYLSCTILRMSVQIATCLLLIAQMIWTVMIVWGQ